MPWLTTEREHAPVAFHRSTVFLFCFATQHRKSFAVELQQFFFYGCRAFAELIISEYWKLGSFCQITPRNDRRASSRAIHSSRAAEQMEGRTPTVSHRSVEGVRDQLSRAFPFDHQEIFSALGDSHGWRLGGSTSRVFEVWTSAKGSRDHASSDEGSGETLLGLAKVSLSPFASMVSASAERSEGADGDNDTLAVAADGPVVVMDPFSGRFVGELSIFLALGTAAAIAARPAAMALPKGEVTGEGPAPLADGRAISSTRAAEEHRNAEEESEVRGREWTDGEQVITHDESPTLDDSMAGEMCLFGVSPLWPTMWQSYPRVLDAIV